MDEQFWRSNLTEKQKLASYKRKCISSLESIDKTGKHVITIKKVKDGYYAEINTGRARKEKISRTSTDYKDAVESVLHWGKRCNYKAIYPETWDEYYFWLDYYCWPSQFSHRGYPITNASEAEQYVHLPKNF